MFLQSRATPLRRALTNNSRARVISQVGFEATGTEPQNAPDAYPLIDGIVTTTEVADESPNGVKVFPISECGPGGIYWVRVWGWHRFGADPATLLWIPCLLAELVCIAGTQHGLEGRLVKETEWFARDIRPTRGVAYVTVGATAYATINVSGCQKIQFDIAPGDGAPAWGNVLFAFIS